MTEKRTITKEDIFLEARVRSEGAQIEFKNASPDWQPDRADLYQYNVILDGCDIAIGLWNNPSSHLKVVFNDEHATIFDNDEVLGTGKQGMRPSWHNLLLNDGTSIRDANTLWSADIADIMLSSRCTTYPPCKYCSNSSTLVPFRDFGLYRSEPTLSAFEELKARNVEATAIALQNGWRGTILFTGGTPPRSQHDKITDEMERILNQLRDTVGNEILSQNQIMVTLFSPPKDLDLLYRWKDIGINATEFETELVDPNYFKAICPGKGEPKFWTEAQAASVEIFGHGRGSTTGIVMGLEPMDGMLKGIEERISKGVFTQLFTFMPIVGSPYEGFMPPSAKWFVEASEKIVDIYLRYANTFDVDLTEDTRFGYTRNGRSYYLSIVDDEMSRRLQEMGKLGRGLPKQEGIEQT
ncbi:hypothetical protein LCGC14_0320750 [marine sediment metagenome]|uniref:Radical SAM core domain-containing protein n=1 Tax=marine sediment metagenome TaxID=412755 RepID=A0A0F9WRF8_9ZZZZ